MRFHRGAVMLALAGAAVVFSGTSIAQTQTMPTTSDTSTNSSDVTGHATFLSKDGVTVTVRSLTPKGEQWEAPPAFSSLDTNHNGSISKAEASAYPPLANAFQYADTSHNGSISKSEYSWWIKQP